MNPGKYVVMDATISLHTFGRRNNWFSNRLHTLSMGSFKMLLAAICVVTLLSLALLTAVSIQSLQAMFGLVGQIEQTSDLAQQVMFARVQGERFAGSTDPAAYSAGESALDTDARNHRSGGHFSVAHRLFRAAKPGIQQLSNTSTPFAACTG